MSEINAEQAIASGWSEPQPVSYTKRDLILYAIGTGSRDLPFIYENHDQFAALPWYPVVLPFKGDENELVSFPSDIMMKLGAHVQGGPMPKGAVLDGERYLEVLNPLPPAGTKLFIKQRVTAITDKKSGCLSENEAIIFDATGKEYVRIIAGAFFVGVSGFKSAGVTNSLPVKIPDRKPDSVVEQQTSPNQAEIYRLSGDYNPLHVDPDMAPVFGFQKPILHGLCSFGHSARHVLATYADNDPKRFKAIKVRFTKPVFPGETLVTKMWLEGNRVLFQTEVKERGVVCMSQCYVDLTVPPSKL